MDSQDLSGRRMPEQQVSMTPELRLPVPAPALLPGWLSDGLAMTAAIDLLYRSNSYLDSDLDPHTRQDKYVMLNGRIGLLALGLQANYRW